MDVENDSKRGSEEPASPIADATKKANNAIRDTARTYLSKFGVNQDKIEVAIRERPVPLCGRRSRSRFRSGRRHGYTTRVGDPCFVRSEGRERGRNEPHDRHGAGAPTLTGYAFGLRYFPSPISDRW